LYDFQPDVLEFLVSRTEGWVQAQSISLSFCVFKVYEEEHPGKAVRVKREDFEVAFDQAKTWMAQLEGPDMDDAPNETDPFLLSYIIERLSPFFEDGTKLSSAEEIEILLLVKTVMVALDRALTSRNAKGS